MFPRFRAPETMTVAEQAALRRATGAHTAPRDHVLYSMALGTGLRLSELLGLNVVDASPDGRTVRQRIVLAVTKGSRRGEVFLPARLIPKLRRFLAWKCEHGESLEMEAPLFVSAQGRRLSPRAAQWRFARWQERTGFDRSYNFHCLRHSSVTNIYRASRNLFLAQRFARHSSPLTTIIYTHPSDDELYAGVRLGFSLRALHRPRAAPLTRHSYTSLACLRLALREFPCAASPRSQSIALAAIAKLHLRVIVSTSRFLIRLAANSDNSHRGSLSGCPPTWSSWLSISSWLLR